MKGNLAVAALGLWLMSTSGMAPGDSEKGRLDPRADSSLSFTSDLNQSSILSLDPSGTATVTVLGSDGETDLIVETTGYGADAELVLDLSAQHGATLNITTTTGRTTTVQVESAPEGATLRVEETLSTVHLSVSDPTGEQAGPAITAIRESDTTPVSVRILFDDAPVLGSGRIVPGFPGLEGGNALGGSATLSAAGLSTDDGLIVAFHFDERDTEEIEELDLLLHRFEASSGRFEVVGTNPRGLGAPTSRLGDYGLDGDQNLAWAVVDRLGSFAVGRTDNTLGLMIEEEDNVVAPIDARGPACGLLGGLVGMVSLLVVPLGLFRMFRR